MLAKDGDSHENGCESAYLVESGLMLVQGPVADADTWANVKNPLPGEGGVLIKPEILAEAVRKLGL